MSTIRLSDSEMFQAATAGARRRIASLLRHAHDPRFIADSWGLDIEGAAAELAVAKALGFQDYEIPVYLDGPQPRGEGDVDRFHVRSTKHADGCLILHPGDPEATFILVTGQIPTFTIAGWTRPSIGRVPEWHRPTGGPGGKPAWFVPQSALRPLPEQWAA